VHATAPNNARLQRLRSVTASWLSQHYLIGNEYLLNFRAAAAERQLLFAGIKPVLSHRRQAGHLALQVVAVQVGRVVLRQRLLVREVRAGRGAVEALLLRGLLHASTAGVGNAMPQSCAGLRARCGQMMLRRCSRLHSYAVKMLCANETCGAVTVCTLRLRNAAAVQQEGHCNLINRRCTKQTR
jgi:hypothetical protein